MALEIIRNRFDTRPLFSTLQVLSPVDDVWTRNTSTYIQAAVWFVVVIVLLFCVFTLASLLRLIFAPDKKSFALLKNIGVSARNIYLIGILVVVLMALIAFPIAVILLEVARNVLLGASVIYAGVGVGAGAFIAGFGITFIISVLCAILAIREKPEAKKQRFIISPTAPVYKLWHNRIKTMFTLRLKTQNSARDWRRFAVFLTASLLVIVTVTLTFADVREKSPATNMTFPFDIIITEVANPTQSVVNYVVNTNGVGHAVRGGLHLHQQFTSDNLAFNNNLIAMSEEGFQFFDATFESTQRHEGKGAVVGRSFARAGNFRIGDYFSIVLDGQEFTFIISEIADANFLSGRFALVDISALENAGRAYTEVFVITEPGASIYNVITSVNQNTNQDLLVFGAAEYFGFISALVFDVFFIIDGFLIGIMVLAVITLLMMIIMRNSITKKEILRLGPLGVSPWRRIIENSFVFSVLLLPLMLLLPFIVLVLSQASFWVYASLGIREIMQFRVPLILTIIIIGYIILLSLETITCAIATKKATKYGW